MEHVQQTDEPVPPGGDLLASAIAKLKDAMNAVEPDAPDLLERCLARFDQARLHFARHVQASRTERGLLGVADDGCPNLAPQVTRLRDEQLDLVHRLNQLRRTLYCRAELPDPARVHTDLNQILAALRKHEGRSEDLLHRAYVADVGAGD